ncbi:MAG: carbamoyltransferase C-terminal domain-containing protein, partial [Pseudomonadota bacterium]
IYAELIRKHLIDIKEDGSFRLNMKYFKYPYGLEMTNSAFHDLMGGPPRERETSPTQKDMDIAASIQVVTEEVMINLARYALKITGKRHLCMAGGVALNCVGNGKILEKVENLDGLFIQPAAGDAGCSLGGALFVWHNLLNKPRAVNGVDDSQKGSLLGPSFSEEQIVKALESYGAVSHRMDSEEKLADVVGSCIADSKVIGLFNGRAEFGPRALGARSIIGDPRSPEMQKVMNLKIKFRESFRPFAPCVLEEDANKYFNIKSTSPYMLLVAPVTESLRKAMTPEQESLYGIEKLNVPRSEIPAVTHVDDSARIQTVDNVRNPRLYRIMNAFKQKSGCSVIINTSFNVRGEPMVSTPEDAYRCFMFTHMDVLVLENYILYKQEQPKLAGAEEHLAEFELD